MRRRDWFDWHSWVGVNLALLLTFILLTGSLATVSREIDWLFQPAMRAQSAVPVESLPWAQMLSSFHAAFPDAAPHYLQAPVAPWFAPELTALDAEGQRFRVFFDAASGEVQGSARWFNWQRFLRQSHRHLMLPLWLGLSIVGLLALPLLVTLISSLYIYRQWWRGFFRRPGSGRARRAASVPRTAVRSLRQWWGDLHRLAGVWSLWFILLIGVTGLWYLAELWGLAARYPPVPAAAEPVAHEYSSRVFSAATLREALARARRDYPALSIRAIRFDHRRGVLLLQGQAQALLVRDRANHAAYDAAASLVDLRRGEALGWHLRISEAADPLHFGTLGGTPTRLLWAFFGLLMTGLSASGVYLYGLRLLSRPPEGPAPPRALAYALRRIPLRYAAPSATLVVLALLLGAISWWAPVWA